MEITTKQILKVLYVLSWIIFLGLCVEAGGFICSAIYAVGYNPEAANFLWHGTDLSGIYQYDWGHFLVVIFFMTIVKVFQALLFYLIVKILHKDKLDMKQPFNADMGRFIFNLVYLAFGTALFSGWGFKYCEWLMMQGAIIPKVYNLGFDGADVWMFMAVLFFIIGHMFKRGIEIQNENELTV